MLYLTVSWCEESMQVSPIVIAHARVTYDNGHLRMISASVILNSLAEVS